MEWRIGLEGREFSKLEFEKKQVLNPAIREDLSAVAALALEVVGVRKIVRLGDPRLWRQAVSELDTLPLAPLNLPLPIWDLYQAHPFASVTLKLANGQDVAVPDWSKFYYCWHGRTFAIEAENSVQFYDATQVVGGDSKRPPGAHTTTLESLRWLKAAEKPMVFIVRTRQGRAFLVEGPGRFQLDPSGSVLVLRFCEEQPLEFVPISEISAVVLTNSDTRPMLEQLQRRLNASPFAPFHVQHLNGQRYTINRSQDALVTKKALIVGHGGAGENIYDDAVEIALGAIDRIETMPAEISTQRRDSQAHGAAP